MAKLPTGKKWQSGDILEFLDHLKKDNFYLNQTQTLSLPKELLEDEPELQPPDPDVLFPEVKEDLDRRVTSENLYHFSLEEIEKIKHGLKNIVRTLKIMKILND